MCFCPFSCRRRARLLSFPVQALAYRAWITVPKYLHSSARVADGETRLRSKVAAITSRDTSSPWRCPEGTWVPLGRVACGEPPQLVVVPRSTVCVKIPSNGAFEAAASSRPETASLFVLVALPWGQAHERGPVGEQALVLRHPREPGEW